MPRERDAVNTGAGALRLELGTAPFPELDACAHAVGESNNRRIRLADVFRSRPRALDGSLLQCGSTRGHHEPAYGSGRRTRTPERARCCIEPAQALVDHVLARVERDLGIGRELHRDDEIKVRGDSRVRDLSADRAGGEQESMRLCIPRTSELRTQKDVFRISVAMMW